MKAKFVELHLLQNFPPSCVNRDGNNSPKDCEFGGVRRARISSQCLKRATRTADSFEETVGEVAMRTRRLVTAVARAVDGLADDAEPSLESLKRTKAAFAMAGLPFPEPKKTKGKKDASAEEATDESEDDPTADDYTSRLLLYASKGIVTKLADVIRSSSGTVSDDVAKLIIEGVRVPDIALFGRMLAIKGNTPLGKANLNVDAACQMAHAISTNRLSMEMDYWTAVDDLMPSMEPGAGMLGTAEFNSSCFYRYGCVSLRTLEDNLKDDDLVRRTVEAFLWASWDAIPTGKLNGHGHYNEPSMALAVVREQGAPANLANAFERAITPTMRRRDDEPRPGKESLVINSAWELARYYDRRRGAERFPPSALAYWHGLDAGDLPGLPSEARTDGYRTLVERTLGAL